MSLNRFLKCPGCGKEIEYTDKNPFRPFCSKSCKMSDLCAWFSEEYAISSPIFEDDDNELETDRNDTEFLQ